MPKYTKQQLQNRMNQPPFRSANNYQRALNQMNGTDQDTLYNLNEYMSRSFTRRPDQRQTQKQDVKEAKLADA